MVSEISSNIQQIIPAKEQSFQNAINGIIEIIEDSARVANTVTRVGLVDLLKKFTDRIAR